MIPHELAFRRALALVDAGNFPAAIEPLRDVLTGDPGNAPAHLLLAVCLRMQGRPVGARYEAEQAIALDPMLAHAHVERAQALFLLQERRAAVAAIEEAIALDPHDPVAHLVHARFMRAMGRDAEARASVDRTLALAPAMPAALAERGYAAVAAGDMAVAADAARAALAQDPRSSDALVILGHVELAAGDTAEALRLALAALQHAPSDLDALALLAAAKMRGNLLGGLWWRWNRLLVKLGEARAIYLTVGMWVIYRWLSLGALDAGLPDSAGLMLTIAYLGFVLYTLSAQAIVDRLIRREIEKVRLDPAF